MDDRARALALLDRVEQCCRKLEDRLPPTLSAYEQDDDTRLIVERVLHVAIEALTDLAGLVVSGLRLGLPADERTLLDRLREGRVLSRDHAELLAEMRRFRNVLVHRYETVDHARVFAHAGRAPAEFRALATAFRAAFDQRGLKS